MPIFCVARFAKYASNRKSIANGWMDGWIERERKLEPGRYGHMQPNPYLAHNFPIYIYVI